MRLTFKRGNMRNNLTTFSSVALYLVFIAVTEENVILYKQVVANGSRTLTRSSDGTAADGHVRVIQNNNSQIR